MTMRRSDMPLRVPMLIQLVVPLGLLFATAAALGVWLAGSSAERAAHAQARAHAAVVIETLRTADYPLTAAVLDKVRGFSGFELIVAEESRSVVGTIAGSADAWLEIRDTHFDESRDPLDAQVRVNGKAYRAAFARLPERSGRGRLKLALLAPEDSLHSSLIAAKSPPIAAFLGGQVVALGVVVWFARRLARRIGVIQSKAADIAAGEHPHFVAGAFADELGDLAASMNALADRLAEYRKNFRQMERMRLLHQLAGGLAHRLRNAVGGARLALQLHQRENAGEPSETVAMALEQLTVVESHVQLLLQTKSASSQRRPVDLRAVVRSAVHLMQAKARHLGIRLEATDGGAPLEALGDAAAFERMLNVLLDNGLEAAGVGGLVAVECEGVELNQRRWVAVRVCDSGPGLPASEDVNLFEPFATTKIGGIGLGLFVARSIAEAHGGSLSTRRRGEQTVFEFVAPAVAHDAMPGSQPQAEAAMPTDVARLQEWSVPS